MVTPQPQLQEHPSHIRCLDPGWAWSRGADRPPQPMTKVGREHCGLSPGQGGSHWWELHTSQSLEASKEKSEEVHL